MADSIVDTLIAQFQEHQARANAANEQRFQQGMEIFDRVIERYKEGGTFLAATEAQLERAGTRSAASGMQNLVSSGLAGTTQVAGLRKKFEEEVGAPARLQAQDIASQRLTQAEIGKTGFIERREDTGPDFATIASLAKSIGQGSPSSSGGSAPIFHKNPATALERRSKSVASSFASHRARTGRR